MSRKHRGLRVTGPEATLVRLAYLLDGEAFEVACEDARRRRLISVPSLHAYLEKYARPGQRGVAPVRTLLRELDPVHPSRSTLEVKTRRLLVAHGIGDFVREYPLEWNGRRYSFDFTFPRARTILETNGRRWHDDAHDFEHDQEKWSVPGRHGYKLVLATWGKVTEHSRALVHEIRTTLAA
jgi:very-short-patch-repair endonuclease